MTGGIRNPSRTLANEEVHDMTIESSEATLPVATGRPVSAARRGVDAGIAAALLSSAAFGTSGPFAKLLLHAGWTSGSIVLVRVGGAALILLVPALLAVRGRAHLVRANLPLILVYGFVAVAGCQVAYFNAVQHVPVGVALLLEYCGTVLVVLWAWLRFGRRPTRLTWLGVAVSLAGLALVLDIAGQSRLDPVGVFWGLLAAVGLAAFFVAAAHGEGDLPPVVLAALGMGIGAVLLAILGAVHVLPMGFSTADVTMSGRSLSWWVPVAELAVIAAAAAYLLGTYAARRLGSTVSSFVGLSEVLFAIVAAWLLLGELPHRVQLLGGALIVGGVVAVRTGELRRPV
jgi:drug/metabolite transporter (DMT)-like permease